MTNMSVTTSKGSRGDGSRKIRANSASQPSVLRTGVVFLA